MSVKKKCAFLLSILLGIVMLVASFCFSGLTVFADEEYAEMKGFEVEGLKYSDDKSLYNRGISTLGNMSLWVGRYNFYANNNQTYTALFIEAKLCATANDARNSQMVIDVYHLDGKESELLMYSPTESSSGSTTVSESIGIEVGGDDVTLGYSFDSGKVYPDVDMLCYSYNNVRDEILIDATRVGLKYIFNWNDPAGEKDIISPYHGEIIKRMVVIFKVDFNTNPEYDSDSDTFVIDYTGELYSRDDGDYEENNIKFTCGMNGIR